MLRVEGLYIGGGDEYTGNCDAIAYWKAKADISSCDLDSCCCCDLSEFDVKNSGFEVVDILGLFEVGACDLNARRLGKGEVSGRNAESDKGLDIAAMLMLMLKISFLRRHKSLTEYVIWRTCRSLNEQYGKERQLCVCDTVAG